MKHTKTNKRNWLTTSVIALSIASLSCDGGSDSSSSTPLPEGGNTTGNTTQPNPNALESYTITVKTVVGQGLGYSVGDRVTIQRTSNSIIVGDIVYSPYEVFFETSLNGNLVSQYIGSRNGDATAAVINFNRSNNSILVQSSQLAPNPEGLISGTY